MYLNVNKQIGLWLLACILCKTQVQAQQYYSDNSSNAQYYNPMPSKLYTRVMTPLKPVTDTALVHMQLSAEELMVVTSYSDIYGRPIQTVMRQASPTKKDMVQPTAYDVFDMSPNSYPAYTHTSNTDNNIVDNGNYKNYMLKNDSAFYKALYPNENSYFSKVEYEASPLARVTKALPAGNNWVGANRGTVITQRANTLADSVRLWVIPIGSINDVPTTTTTYIPGSLVVEEVTNEQGLKKITYTNERGEMVLSKVQIDNTPGTAHIGWLCTYYIYDEMGALRTVLPPKAISTMLAAGFTTTSFNNVQAELSYRYYYDNKARLTVKQLPGSGKTYMVYDVRDKLVMTQDSSLKTQNKWNVVLYDVFNRPYKTGIWNSTNNQAYHTTQANTQANAATVAYPFSAEPTTGWELLSHTGYDDYTGLPTASGLNSTLITTNITAANFETQYNQSPTFAQPIAVSNAIKGSVTWTKTKVLNTTSTFLYTLSLYDHKNRVIQTKATNITGGVDVSTLQYDFSGKVLVSYATHQKAGTNANTYHVRNRMYYDHAGRLLGTNKLVYKQGETNLEERWVSSVNYDELGRSTNKKIGIDYATTTPLETFNYEYNIRGWLLGVNRQFINSSTGNSTIGNYFGYELAYDNNVNATGANYNTIRYDGNIAGTTWKTAGDGVQRKYDYTYDNANRLLKADYTQKNGTAYNTTAGINYSVLMGNGTSHSTAYDGNGNILKMQQYGWKITGSTLIDNLTYTYNTNSNKLKQVKDAVNDTTTKLGDFYTQKWYPGGVNKATTATDYTYDVNGNLLKDLNKAIGNASNNGIAYNHLNLPRLITVRKDSAGANVKGTIEYIYDATGAKLQKKVTEGTLITTTTYVAGFVYESISNVNSGADSLQYLMFEEGRIRPIPLNSSNQTWAYDYMLKDNLGNVRMVITDEKARMAKYPAATLEGLATDANSAIAKEQPFYTINTANVVAAPAGMPAYQNNNGVQPMPSTANSSKVYKLDAAIANAKTGLGITLKVMAGDKINIWAKSYHTTPGGANGYNGATASNLSIADIITAFVGSAGITGKGITATQITNQTGFLPTGATNLFNNNNSPAQTNTMPKAAVNWIVFDEQFKLVKEASNFDGVGESGVLKNHQFTQTIPKNGYIYIYCSNESQYPVYFDNLQVIQEQSAILEETHYYPFGLVMAGISSKAATNATTNNAKNNYKYNGKEAQEKEFIDGGGLNWLDYGARMYDNQIGRWHCPDPLSEVSRRWTPYNYCDDNPINYIDPDGRLKMASQDYGADWNDFFEWLGSAFGSSYGGFDGGHFSGQSFSGLSGGGVGGGGSGNSGGGPRASGAGRSGSSQVNKASNNWEPFYKNDLINYVKSKGIEPTENNLGNEFENIVETYMWAEYGDALKQYEFKRGNLMVDKSARNTKPDFTAIGGYYERDCFLCKPRLVWFDDWDIYEVKQNSGRGIYLSSNDHQIRGHIDNLRATHAVPITSKKGNPGLTLLTTYDVGFSLKTASYALKNGVRYTHRRAKYMIVGGVYLFSFVGFGTSSL
jgi:RHS repeat-associated protein